MERYYAEEFTRLQEYVRERATELTERFGSGQDGLVYATTRDSAVKCLRFPGLYRNELLVYRRLADHKCDRVAGFNVPQLIDCSPELRVIEMEIVAPPFVVDFAGATLDKIPSRHREMTEEEHAEWLRDCAELYGEHWSRVEDVLSEFRQMGIHLSDINKRNIRIENE